MKKFTFISAALLLLAFNVHAQSYSIDWFTMDGGGGTSTGGGYSMSGSIAQVDSGTMSGGGYTLDGTFWSIVTAATGPVTIFENTGGSVDGFEWATTNVWLANKLCLGPQSYQLDSVSLLLNNQDLSGQPGPPSAVRLQVYPNDPVSGNPFASTGLIMRLSGLTNPITPLGGQQLVTWVPATPFILAASTCYWVVPSTDAGTIAEIDSFTMPGGDAGAFGRGASADAGVTWHVYDTGSNLKMLIRGIALPTPLDLLITSTERIGNGLRLSFTSVAGRNYALQSCADLSSGAWTNLPGAPTPGTGETVQVTLLNALDQPQQFYRVQVVP